MDFLHASGPISSHHDARSLANVWLSKFVVPQLEDPIALSDWSEERDGVYLFSYNSEEFLRTGDVSTAIVGQGLITVDAATGIVAMEYGSSEGDVSKIVAAFKQSVAQGTYA